MRTLLQTRSLLCVVLMLPGVVFAQNLLANGDFDTDLSGWTPNGTGSASHDAVAGSPGSGSASLFINDPSGNGITEAIQQCVAVVVGAGYMVSGRAMLGTVTGATSGDGMFIIGQFFPNFGCTGSPTSFIANSTGTASGQPSNFTTYSTALLIAPAGSTSIKFTAQIQTGGGGAGSAQGWADHLSLTSDVVFRDGFE